MKKMSEPKEPKKCECGKPLEGENAVSSITGKMANAKEDAEPVTMCFDCFHKNFRLKKGVKTNVFVRK